jgi:hypothetical protein
MFVGATPCMRASGCGTPLFLSICWQEVCVELETRSTRGAEWQRYSAPRVWATLSQLDTVESAAELVVQPNGTALCGSLRLPRRAGIFTASVTHHRVGFAHVRQDTKIRIFPSHTHGSHAESSRGSSLLFTLLYYAACVGTALSVLAYTSVAFTPASASHTASRHAKSD